jgi:nicotinamide mononucleotide transporter
VNAFCAWLVAHGSTCLEFSAVLVGIVSVFLSVRQNIWSWPTALVNVALYSVVFYQSGLYSDMGLQVVYFALSLYGWYEWLYGGAGHTTLSVSRTPRRTWLILSVTGLAFWAVDGALTSRLPGVAVPYIDAATATTSLVAQYMMTRKLLENWIVWIVVDVAYVALFIWRGLYLTAVNYAVYLVLAVLGYLAWKRSLNAAAA